MLDAALRYYCLGWSVIPLNAPTPGGGCSCGKPDCKNAGKHPRIPWAELQQHRAAEEQIRDWWTRWPDANVGILTGAVSGVVVVDIDGPEAEAWVRGKPVPRTPAVRTGKGWHLYFKYPGFVVPNAARLVSFANGGIDVRGDGGLVVAPPSIHVSGRRYAWAKSRSPWECELADLPDWVLELLQSRQGPAQDREQVRDPDWVLELLQGVPQGQRNDAATRLAGHWLAKGLSESEVWFLLREWNARNRPPLSERELEQVFKSIANREARKPKKGNGETEESFLAPPSWPDPPAPAAFHGLAGDIVRAIGPHTEADPVALLVQTLVFFGNAIGRTGHFVAEADKHFTNQFAVLVGTTAKGRKGSSFGHIRRLFRVVDPEWAEKRVQFGLSSGEGLIWAVHDPIEKTEPVYDGEGRKREVVDYKTVVVDPGVEDKRLLVYEAEFATCLRVLQREGNTLSAIIRNAWDTGELQSLTKNSQARATGAHISIVGHITKDELLRYLDTTEAGNGFGNRFLWACVKRSKVLPLGGQVSEETLQPLVNRLKQAVQFARGVGEMRFDPEAETLWCEVYPQLSEGKPGLLGAMIARAEAHVVRLACLYALLDRSEVIKRPHLEAALALWDYCERSARFIFGDALGDPVADEILRLLRTTPEGVTRTEISNYFGRNLPARRIGRALAVLVENGLAESRKEQTDGRAAERWFAIHASIYDTKKTNLTKKVSDDSPLISSNSFNSYLYTSDERTNSPEPGGEGDTDDFDPDTLHDFLGGSPFGSGGR